MPNRVIFDTSKNLNDSSTCITKYDHHSSNSQECKGYVSNATLETFPSSKGNNIKVPEFNSLEVSTRTVMCYTNINFNRDVIFKNLKITGVTVPPSKKQRNLDKKKLDAIPYGAIIGSHMRTMSRGLYTRKKKKRWCTVCRPISYENDKETKVMTISEDVFNSHDYFKNFVIDHTPPPNDGEVKVKGTSCKDINNKCGSTSSVTCDTGEIFPDDTSYVMYYCSKCNKYYHPYEIKKINHFLNQLSVVLSIGKKPLLDVMIFKDNMKFAGCKQEDDEAEAMLILWQDYIFPMKDAWSLKEGETVPKFVFEEVMYNVGFKLGFNIDRKELNLFMNSDTFAKKVYMSQFEATAQSNVNIKMYNTKPKNYKYDCLVIPINISKKPYFDYLLVVPFKKEKKRIKDNYTTLIVFSSSEIIMSGRYKANMADIYNFFVNTLFTNRYIIEEKLNNNNKMMRLKDILKD